MYGAKIYQKPNTINTIGQNPASPLKFILLYAIFSLKFSQKLLVAFRAVFVLAADVAVLGADAKDRRYRDIRQLVVAYHAAYEIFASLRRADALLHIQVQHRAAGVGALQFVLQIERLERVVGEICRQLRGVGVVDIFAKSRLDDIRIALFILFGKAIRRALGRCGFEVIKVTCALLKLANFTAQKLDHLDRKLSPEIGRDIFLVVREISQKLVHAVDADGAKVVVKVL